MTGVRELRGRVAVVTGGASGIGLGIAEALLAAGAKVVLADLDTERLLAERARLASDGGDVVAVVTDVGDPDQVEALAEATIEAFGDVHVICNNAGVVRPGRSWELPLDDWDLVLGVNLLGVVHGVRSFVPRLLAAGHEGHVVNVASMAAVTPVPGIGPYNVSKHGVLALSETLHAELVAAGAPIGVTVVMPGRVRSRLGQAPGQPDPAPTAAPPAPEPGVLEPADVGARVLDAIRDGRLHLFTHPERRADVAARFGRILDAF
ncbi:MAG: SDR family NAD(P)-dependent oxidoreductase [Acidimicrobiia bacterium]